MITIVTGNKYDCLNGSVSKYIIISVIIVLLQIETNNGCDF